jgi:hypothetical protein
MDAMMQLPPTSFIPTFLHCLALLVGSSLLNKSWQQYTISFLDEQLGSQSMFVVDSIRG